jgi:hypothetical protein
MQRKKKRKMLRAEKARRVLEAFTILREKGEAFRPSLLYAGGKILLFKLATAAPRITCSYSTEYEEVLEQSAPGSPEYARA